MRTLIESFVIRYKNLKIILFYWLDNPVVVVYYDVVPTKTKFD